VAEHVLIDRYLRQLELELRWLRDAEEIIEEVADHLLEAVAMYSQHDLDSSAAEQRALSEFGDPILVGQTFASSRSGGIAVPTRFTRFAGVALVASSVLWLIGVALIYAADVADRTRPWEDLPQTYFTFGAFTLLAAGVLLAVGILGINRRHGGALGNAGRLAFWIAVVTAIAGPAAWMWGVWLTALGVGAVVLAVALQGSDIAPRVPGLLVGLGGALAAGSIWVVQLTTDEVDFGEGIGTALAFAGLVIYAVGLALLGGWLSREVPVDDPQPVATA
jgi:hypothetical protein